MNKHVKTLAPEATDLSRRSFLVGTAATGLVLGYVGVLMVLILIVGGRH